MTKINILQVVSGMDRGGVETFLMNILRSIDTKTYHFIFLCYSDKKFDYEDELIALGGKIVRIGGPKSSGIYKYIKEFQKVIYEEKINVVHVHTFYNAGIALFAAKLSKVKIRIAHSHNTRTELNSRLMKRIYFVVSTIMINSFSTKRIACSYDAGMALFKKNNFKIIKNGIILNDFEFSTQKRMELRSSLGIDDNEMVIMHAGRFSEAKNHLFLIDIFELYLTENPHAKLVLVGDGELRTAVENKVMKSGLEKNIMFLGKRSDIASLYNAADLFILPSFFEGLGIVLIEAQANGLACLASDRVPEEVNVSQKIVFESLDSPVKEWVSDIRRQIGNRDKNGLQSSHDEGYDISNTVSDTKLLYDEAR